MVKSSTNKDHGGMPIASPKYADLPELIALGAAIKQVRSERKMSQEELAHQAGIDRSYASSIERGRQNPGIVLILQLAAALGISASELMERAGL
ncbi:helix-turn-helix transcriptional regulator [Comamonas sp.]|uniref:helix-turn-helix domain-containing protein n=1 Tax=Comamonas sp. TaxID=34028 RepID=UPI002899D00C|nr:helix-turn-helix transcriptional regulator [Comamonas sp.]